MPLGIPYSGKGARGGLSPLRDIKGKDKKAEKLTEEGNSNYMPYGPIIRVSTVGTRV